MKRIFMAFLMLLVSLSVANAENICKIVTSPAQSIKDVKGSDGVALSIRKAYRDKDEKFQFTSFQEAYLDFQKQLYNYIKADCKKYNITIAYNLKINSIVDENYYHFNATWDFN